MDDVATGRTHWVVISATTTLWLAHLVGMAILAGADCGGVGEGPLHWLTVALLVPTLALGWASHRRNRAGEDETFLARLAVMVAAVNVFAIVVEWVPVFLLEACA